MNFIFHNKKSLKVCGSIVFLQYMAFFPRVISFKMHLPPSFSQINTVQTKLHIYVMMTVCCWVIKADIHEELLHPGLGNPSKSARKELWFSVLRVQFNIDKCSRAIRFTTSLNTHTLKLYCHTIPPKQWKWMFISTELWSQDMIHIIVNFIDVFSYRWRHFFFIQVFSFGFASVRDVCDCQRLRLRILRFSDEALI